MTTNFSFFFLSSSFFSFCLSVWRYLRTYLLVRILHACIVQQRKSLALALLTSFQLIHMHIHYRQCCLATQKEYPNSFFHPMGAKLKNKQKKWQLQRELLEFFTQTRQNLFCCFGFVFWLSHAPSFVFCFFFGMKLHVRMFVSFLLVSF